MSFGIVGAYDIRVDDTFVMVGGAMEDCCDGCVGCDVSDALIKYLPESGTFIELPSKMKFSRYEATAMLVERSIFPSCE